ncbi:uncharacterized protein LOC134848809 [Symsagittifera roscoffensis]|uniref:uncharacterized protein LOC134848809 n=1 Tax=Symsagittifera roscoffensis TaxID=84072 RepID=UPI00307C82A2
MTLSAIVFVGLVDLSIQWVCFVFSALLRTEKFFDLVGGSSFIICVSLSFHYNDRWNDKIALIQYCFVVLWAMRLGMFLVYRIWRDGKDRRFDDIKSSIPKLFITWNFQAVWVFLTLLPTLWMFEWSNFKNKEPSMGQYIGWSVWMFGFAFETISDHQKLIFKEKPENARKFIKHGLWSISRHPNYFGEIALWWGLFIAAVGTFDDPSWTLYTVIGPLFVTFLLGFFSLRMLEQSSDEKYGQNAQYSEYKQKTNILIPFIL